MTCTILRRSAIILAAALALGSPTGAQSAHELFQRALSKERAEGNLQEAIKLYQRVVDTASADHALAAKALLQLGRCYEQLGNTEARAAYERLIARYPDQTDVVAQAKSRLVALVRSSPPTTTPGSMTVQPLPDVKDMILTISHDGTKAIVWDFSKGQNLALHDFSRKQRRVLTEVDYSAGLIDFAVWSPDARRVAYQQNNYQQGKDVSSELRVTTLDGRSSTIHRTDRYGGVQPVGWTPDGATVVAVVGRPDKTWTLGTLPATGGQFTPLRSFGWSYDARDGSPRVSPDGRFIAYLEGDRGVRDVHAVSLDGRQAFRITTDPADDFAPIWAPDSRHVAFKSNRLGSVAMWTVEVKDGQPVGQPIKLKDGMQSAQLIDWIERGIVYLEAVRTSDLFTVPVDAEGRPTASPRPISYFRTGRNIRPVWSPDGKRLAFVSSAAAEPNRRFVVVMPIDGGQAREFLIPTTSWLNQQTPFDLRWFGNGRGLGLSGQDTRGAPAVFRLRLDTGEWDTIPLSEQGFLARTEWNHDGSAVYIARQSRGLDGDGGIFERAVEGDAERPVYRSEASGNMTAITALEFSPDRKWLAFRHSTVEGKEEKDRILVVDVGTGETRTVIVEPSNDVGWINIASWTPSGDLLIHRLSGQRAETPGTAADILLVPANGGTPRPFAVPRIAPIAPGDTSLERLVKWSPDGRTMVLGRQSRGGETFVIENPLATVRPATARR
jgi:Tol biopolymer transport system component